jgi:hypothetical protein
VVATVFADSNKKYLSTDLLREEPARDGYLAPEVELKGFSSLPRVCAMCYDAPEAAVRALQAGLVRAPEGLDQP